MSLHASWRRAGTGVLAALLLLACGPATLLALACGPASTGSAPPAAPASAPAGTAPASSAAPTAADAPAPLKARFAYTTIAGSVAPWWMALDGGYFREQGIDAELVKIDPGAAILAALRGGDVDATYSGAPGIVLGYLQGMETLIVGSTSNRLDNSLFTRGDVTRLEDLRGKTVGVTRLKAISDISARLAFERVGLNPDTDVTIRGTGGYPETMAALDTGLIDGATLSVEASLQARQRGLYELVNLGDLNLRFMNGAVAATRRVLDERPDLVDRTLRALAQATSRLRTDRDFGIQVYAHFSQIDDTAITGYMIDYYRAHWVPDLYPDPAALQAVLDVEEHPAARTTPASAIIDARFHERLRASGFLDRLLQ
jgi:ABC-type nitrate/sulfonate/bicarbonate transport system substrate-binding protein